MENNRIKRTREEIDAIYRRNIDTVYRLSYIYLKHEEDARDASQNIFLKFIRQNPEFHSIEHERAWFITVTKNQCKDILKSFWRTHWNSFCDIQHIPDKDFEHKEMLELLLSLPSKQKEVLYLYYYEGYSVREISAMLNVKESTLQSRLAAGRTRLKDLMERSEMYGAKN